MINTEDIVDGIAVHGDTVKKGRIKRQEQIPRGIIMRFTPNTWNLKY